MYGAISPHEVLSQRGDLDLFDTLFWIDWDRNPYLQTPADNHYVYD